MIELEIGGQRFPVGAGDALVGTDPSCQIRLAGEGILPRHAILKLGSDGAVSVRPATPEAEVLLNGVRLGTDPAPVLHGDKIQFGAQVEALCSDPQRGGSTQFVSAAELAKMAGQARPAAPAARKATAATGGRLVCLTDGREYAIGGDPLVLGRDAGCDVVVPNKDVSRKHAEILPSPQGYLIVDSSTNGTFVNGERIEGQRILARADVIRLGDHEFRFYADVAPTPPAPSAPAPAPSRPSTAAPPPAAAPAAMAPAPAGAAPVAAQPPSPPPGASHRLHVTMHGMPVSQGNLPAVPRPTGGSGTPLATLLVRTGQLKGTRMPIRVPVVNIGRADYNDLVLPEESVSSQHAKLQRREEVWVLIDLGSTNGSFVDGERVSGEAILSPGASIRLGEISLLFEPPEKEAEVSKGGGTKVLGAVSAAEMMAQAPPAAPKPTPAPPPPAPAAAVPRAPAPARPRPAPAPPPASRGWLVPAIIVIVIAVVIGLFVVLRK